MTGLPSQWIAKHCVLCLYCYSCCFVFCRELCLVQCKPLTAWWRSLGRSTGLRVTRQVCTSHTGLLFVAYQSKKKLFYLETNSYTYKPLHNHWFSPPDVTCEHRFISSIEKTGAVMFTWSQISIRKKVLLCRI